MMAINWNNIIIKEPISTREIVNLCMDAEIKLLSIKQGRRNANELLDVKTTINTIVTSLLSLLHKEDILSGGKSDLIIFEKLKENFGRLLFIIEEKEDKVTTRLENTVDGMKNRVQMTPETLAYISEMESVLYRDIFITLKRVIERNSKDAREFLYNLYEILTISVGVFGSESRVKSKSLKTTETLPLSAKTLMSQKGQEKLDKTFDTQFKGYEDIIKVEQMLKS